MTHTRKDICLAHACLGTAGDQLNAAYWVESDDTRDYLVADALRKITETLNALGYDVVQRRSEPAAEAAE